MWIVAIAWMYVAVMMALADVGSGQPEQIDDLQFQVPIDAGTRSAVSAVKSLQTIGVEVIDASVTAPTLESVFLTLTESASPDPDRAADSAREGAALVH